MADILDESVLEVQTFDVVQKPTVVSRNSTLLWVYGIILLIVFIIIAALISAGYNNATYAGLVKPSSDPGKGGMIIIWLIAFLIIWYAWYQSAKCAPCDRNRTNLNILFGLNLLLVFLFIYSFYVSFNFSAALGLMILLFIETIFLIWYVFKFSRGGGALLLLVLVWEIYLLYWSNQFYTLNKPAPPAAGV